MCSGKFPFLRVLSSKLFLHYISSFLGLNIKWSNCWKPYWNNQLLLYTLCTLLAYSLLSLIYLYYIVSLILFQYKDFFPFAYVSTSCCYFPSHYLDFFASHSCSLSLFWLAARLFVTFRKHSPSFLTILCNVWMSLVLHLSKYLLSAFAVCNSM